MGLETLLAEIAAFPDGKHDDQVDALSYVVAYRAKVIYEARRRWGLKLGRVVLPPAKVQIVPPKVARSGALGPATMASALTRSQQSDVHEKNPSGVGCVAAASTSDPPSREATSARWRAEA
jgi:hypothetical protein